MVASLSVLVNSFEGKYPYSRGHSTRVADAGAMIAAELGLPDVEIEGVRTAGRLHDVGMIGIRDEVANKQGPLTDDEFATGLRALETAAAATPPAPVVDHLDLMVLRLTA